MPFSVSDRALVIGHPFLMGAVVIGVPWHPQAFGSVQERLADRVALVDVGDMLRAAGAMIGVRSTGSVLGQTEIGQHVLIAPAAITELSPGVEGARLAAHMEMSIDRSRAAVPPATRPEYQPSRVEEQTHELQPL